MDKGFLLVVSGPSGVGKGTILRKIEKDIPDLVYSVSATTRKMREGERDGVDYFFKSKEEFKRMVDQGLFLEYAEVHNNYYGTPREFVEEKINQGKVVILEIDVQGGMNIKRCFPDAVMIFLAPPSKEELKKRIINRHTDSMEDIDLRLRNSLKEMEYIREYDYLVINDRLEVASESLKSIVRAEEHKVCRIKL